MGSMGIDLQLDIDWSWCGFDSSIQATSLGYCMCTHAPSSACLMEHSLPLRLTIRRRCRYC